jgi:hypothetical protein
LLHTLQCSAEATGSSLLLLLLLLLPREQWPHKCHKHLHDAATPEALQAGRAIKCLQLLLAVPLEQSSGPEFGLNPVMLLLYPRGSVCPAVAAFGLQ